MTEVINEILKCEKNAKAIVSDAEKKAEEMINSAKEKAKNNKLELDRKSSDESASIIAKLKNEDEKYSRECQKELDASIKRLDDIMNENKDKWSEEIFKGIIS